MAKAVMCKICNKKKNVIFQGNGVQYPVYSCSEHGPDERNEWAIWWEIYSERWKDASFWDKPADRVSCLLGYFCHKYEEFYGYPYTFQISNPIPYKSKDFVMARRILAMFQNDVREIRIFIKWVFAKKIHKNYNLSSLGFFTKADLVNEYKHAKARSAVLKRHTLLPESFVRWCVEEYSIIFDKHDLKTWNDLNGLVSFVNSFGEDNIEGKIVLEARRRGMLPKNGFAILED